VEVVLFDGEDGFEDCHPLAGSLWYVGELGQADMEGMRMLLLDMVGDPDARFLREGHGHDCDPGLEDLLFAKAERNGLADNFVDATTTVLDDHVAFTQKGIPAVDLIDYGRGFPPYWHTTHDTMENLDAGMLGRVGALVLDVMQDPAFTASWAGPC
jgi:Zn-dependent M28 family amino/carboxypeptidase